VEGGVREMRDIQIISRDVSKGFDRRTVLEHITFTIEAGHSLAIIGPNGSGKSTLIKIIARVLSPTSGHVEYHIGGAVADDDQIRESIGFVGPYLQLYDEFSALENLELLNRTRLTNRKTRRDFEETLALVHLADRKDDRVRGFSSGMKQRLKYALALSQAPSVLLLDEPTANLDEEGIRTVQAIVKEQRSRGILILATNNAEEAAWCERTISLVQP
jgi:heme exporter protein A